MNIAYKEILTVLVRVLQVSGLVILIPVQTDETKVILSW